MKYKIKNGLLLLFDGINFYTEKKDLYIDGNKIVSVGDTNSTELIGYKEISADNQLIMPGLINSHTHVYMNFLKNSADDIPFSEWLFNRIFPIEAKMERPDFYWTTLFGCIEMIKTGTTTFLDMHICENECAKAISESGLRGFIGKCLTGKDLYDDGYSSFRSALDEKENYESDLLKFVLSPHSVYTCSEKMLSQINEEAIKRNMLKHIHLSETLKETKDCLASHNCTPVELLNKIGFLDEKTIAAHCVKLSESDIDILNSNNVSVATNPSSNAKLGNGIAPIVPMQNKGINICLGTDSAASNNTLNLFREMGIFSMIHKASNSNSTDLTANDVLKTVTVNPAKALNMDKRSGIISEGAYADLIFINLHSTSLFPGNNIVSSLCYSANGSEVKSVMINGNFVMKDGVLTTLDTERIYYEVKRITHKYLN